MLDDVYLAPCYQILSRTSIPNTSCSTATTIPPTTHGPNTTKNTGHLASGHSKPATPAISDAGKKPNKIDAVWLKILLVRENSAYSEPSDHDGTLTSCVLRSRSITVIPHMIQQSSATKNAGNSIAGHNHPIPNANTTAAMPPNIIAPMFPAIVPDRVAFMAIQYFLR